MLKVDFSDARVKVRGDWTSEGSVLAGTVTSTCHGIEVEIDLESEETPNRVAALVHNARGAGAMPRRWSVSRCPSPVG
jgi:hypothetical protein